MDSILHTLCSKKRPPFYFFNNSSQKLTNFNDFSYIKSWENLTRTSHTFVHLTCVQVWSTNLDDSRHRVLHLHQWSALWLNAQSLLHIGLCNEKSCVDWINNKKLSYRRGTVRCVVSVEILPIATQQCRNYLYDKSWTNWSYDVGGLQWDKV